MRSKNSQLSQRRSVLCAIGLVATAFLSSCSSNAPQGSLVVEWTVNATKDAALCDQNIGWVVVELMDTLERVTANHGPCHVFTTEFEGAGSGSYTLSAYMLNAGDDTLLSTVAPMQADVAEDLTTTVSIDFPITVAP